LLFCHEETISYLPSEKDALNVSGQGSAILAPFSLQVTELPLGNGSPTCIQPDFHAAGSTGDYWVFLCQVGKVVYWDSR